MLFNSLEFSIFLPAIFFLYWLLGSKNIKSQNLLLVAASYFFYGWWDWRFLSLIFLSTITDFYVGQGLAIEEKKLKRKILLWVSILVNLGMLAFFKYYNFFLDSFIGAFSFFGTDINTNSLNIILPVGISFYTFQTLSYTIDVYKRRLEPTNNFIAFSAFVSFFPQLVAGPIERAKNLLPQFYVKREFDYSKAVDGTRQILWGLVKKMVIADNCAQYANLFFDNPSDYSGSTLVLGAIFFSFQIYGDFSGYSDIAIGTARLFGSNLSRNFNFPYFSRDVAEFWRRWHITLSTWFRDYLYIPLGGSHGGTWTRIRNTFIIFIISGFWHGANWTFIAWGALHAILILPSILNKTNRKNLDVVASGNLLPTVFEIYTMGKTFALVSFSWILFRAESVSQASSYISKIFSQSLFTIPEYSGKGGIIFILIIVFLMIEWVGREQQFAIEKLAINWARPYRWMTYMALVFVIFYFGSFDETSFIYFKF